MKEKKKNSKSNIHGVTLIVLVVTIVILIILAAVSMNMILGDQGIFRKVGEGANSMHDAGVNTQVGFNSITEEMEKLLGNEEIKPEGMTVVEMFKKAKEEGCDGTDCQNRAEHLHPGDYVNYTNPSSGTYASSGIKTGIKRMIQENFPEMSDKQSDQVFEVSDETKWRVLGIEERDREEHLVLIGSPIKKNEMGWNMSIKQREHIINPNFPIDPYYYLYSAESYLNCKEELDNICKIYTNNLADEVRSARIEDISLACGVKVEGANITHVDDGTPVEGAQTFVGESYTLRQGVDCNIDGIISRTPISKDTVVEGTAYVFPYKVININDRVKDMLFAGTESDTKYSKSYWLASPGVKVDSYFAYWGPGTVAYGFASCGDHALCFSDGTEYELGLAVRPVVSLKSNISQNQLQRIEDQTEPTFPENPNL